MVLANPLPCRRLHRPGGEAFARFIKGVKSILARRDNPVLALTILWPFLKPPSHSLPYSPLQSDLLAWSCLCVCTVYLGGLPMLPVCIYSVPWGFTNAACVYLQCTWGFTNGACVYLQSTLGDYQWCLCVSTVYPRGLPTVPVCMYSVPWGFTNAACVYLQSTLGDYQWCLCVCTVYLGGLPMLPVCIYSVPWGLCVSTVYLGGLPMVPVCIYRVPWGITNGACVYLQCTLGDYQWCTGLKPLTLTCVSKELASNMDTILFFFPNSSFKARPIYKYSCEHEHVPRNTTLKYLSIPSKC